MEKVLNGQLFSNKPFHINFKDYGWMVIPDEIQGNNLNYFRRKKDAEY